MRTSRDLAVAGMAGAEGPGGRGQLDSVRMAHSLVEWLLVSQPMRGWRKV